MSPTPFFRPVLDTLNDGKVIRSTVAVVLQAIAAAALIGGFYLLVEILKA